MFASIMNQVYFSFVLEKCKFSLDTQIPLLVLVHSTRGHLTGPVERTPFARKMVKLEQNLKIGHLLGNGTSKMKESVHFRIVRLAYSVERAYRRFLHATGQFGIAGTEMAD